MNANELADELDDMLKAIGLTDNRVPTMLRQQQAEIEALKQIIDANNLNQNIGQFVKPTNEPVAWIKQNPETLQAELHFDKPAKYWATVISNPDIPLYTHPMRKLTDEEINEEIEITFGKIIDPEALQDEIDLARRILKKASRK